MTSLSRVLLFSVVAFVPANTWAAPQTFFGEDLGQGENVRLPSHPNADAARAQFLSNLSGPVTANLENFSPGDSAPLVVDFGPSGSATLLGNGSINEVVSGTNGFGRYPISGTKYWDTGSELISTFSITFSQPQVAFGFYGVDIGDFFRQVTITYAGGSSHTLTIPHTVDGLGGSVVYFAFIDTANPFTSVSFGDTTDQGQVFDTFGFDDFTIATAPQVVVAGVPTLTEWGMVFMALLLAVTAVFYIRRQRIEFRLG
jgi:hypothetical protein